MSEKTRGSKRRFATAETYLRLGKRLFEGPPEERITKREAELFMVNPYALAHESSVGLGRLPQDLWAANGRVLALSASEDGNYWAGGIVDGRYVVHASDRRLELHSVQESYPLIDILGFKDGKPVVVFTKNANADESDDYIYIGNEVLFKGKLAGASSCQLLPDDSLVYQTCIPSPHPFRSYALCRDGEQLATTQNAYRDYVLDEEGTLICYQMSTGSAPSFALTGSWLTGLGWNWGHVNSIIKYRGKIRFLTSYGKMSRWENGQVVEDKELENRSVLRQAYKWGFGETETHHLHYVVGAKDRHERWVIDSHRQPAFKFVSPVFKAHSGTLNYWAWTEDKHLFKMELALPSKTFR